MPDSRSNGDLRSDAMRNRSRLLEAARETFARDGIEAPLEAVAKRAGVGIATLYRRFPTREDLLAAAFEDKIATYGDLAEMALADPDVRKGFRDLIEGLAAMQLADRGFTEILTLSFPSSKRFEAERRRAYRCFGELIARAQADGALHADFVAEDLVILLMANAGVITATVDTAPGSSPRLVGYLLRAFGVTGDEELPEPPSERQMYKALRRSSGARPS